MSELGLSDETPLKKTSSSSKASWMGGLAVLIPFAFYELLSWVDNTTELWPSHDKSTEACFWLAGIAGTAALIGCILIARKAKKTSLWHRTVLIFVPTLLSVVVVFLFSMRAVDLVNGWIDFHHGKTKTYVGLLRISRAYQTHGKGASKDIQTMPFWSDMNVTEQDYQFMLDHRRPDDPAHSPDEISSQGYFCAKVTVEQSEKALRVLHAGSHTLPAGTVMLCPNGLH